MKECRNRIWYFEFSSQSEYRPELYLYRQQQPLPASPFLNRQRIKGQGREIALFLKFYPYGLTLFDSNKYIKLKENQSDWVT